MKKNSLTGVIFIILCLLLTGCSNSEYPQSQNPHLVLISGDNQEGAIGNPLPEPLRVKAQNNGESLSDVEVSFVIAEGDAVLSAQKILTDSTGIAEVTLLLGEILGEVTVSASAEELGEVHFHEQARLPLLEEVVEGMIEGLPAAILPVALVEIDGLDAVALIIEDDPKVDLSLLPVAGELLDGDISGHPVRSSPAIFLSTSDLVDPGGAISPTAGNLLDGFLGSSPGGESLVTAELLINGDPTVITLKGDASEITQVQSLADLVNSGETFEVDDVMVPADELSAIIVDTNDYPQDPALNDYSYTTGAPAQSTLYPLFAEAEPLGGIAQLDILPRLDTSLTLTSATLLPLDGGKISITPIIHASSPLIDSALPGASLYPLPVEFIPAAEVMEEEIFPIVLEIEPIFNEIQAITDVIGQLLLENPEIIADIMSGNISLPELMELGTDLLPLIDDLAQTAQETIPYIGDILDIIENELLPAIIDALPPDGLPFGGTNDGIPSTVADDVIPMIQDYIDLAQAALPYIEQLLVDIDALIPDNFNLISFMSNLMGGAGAALVEDINALIPFIQDGLTILDEQGIPIAYDLLDEIEANLPPEGLPLGEISEVQEFFNQLSLILPPDATLSDLQYFPFLEPILEGILPPEWGPVGNVGIFDTLIPAIESIDVGDEIIPALRDALDALDAGLPGIIDALSGGIGGLPFFP